MITLRLDRQDVETLLAALAAVTPSGGGSARYTLYRRLVDETGIDPDLNKIVSLQRTAADEINEQRW